MKTQKSNIIKEIAQELNCGSDCYYNSKTNEIIAIPSFLEEFDEDAFNEAFGAVLEKINKQRQLMLKLRCW